MNNFYNALTNANGHFLKLNNDTQEILPNKLSVIVDAIKKNFKEKPVLFFSNFDKEKNYVCEDLNDFIKQVSFYNTWSVSFGIWKEDNRYFQTFIEKSGTQIAQTYILCDLIANGKRALVNNEKLFEISIANNKGGYNIAEVFGKNYFTILKEFVEKGYLSKKVYNREKKIALVKQINPTYFDLFTLYHFQKTGYFKYIYDDFKYQPYFYLDYIKHCIGNLIVRTFFLDENYPNIFERKVVRILGIKISYKKQVKPKCTN